MASFYFTFLKIRYNLKKKNTLLYKMGKTLRKSMKRKSMKRKSMKRKSMKHTSMKHTSMKHKSMKRKSMRKKYGGSSAAEKQLETQKLQRDFMAAIAPAAGRQREAPLSLTNGCNTKYPYCKIYTGWQSPPERYCRATDSEYGMFGTPAAAGDLRNPTCLTRIENNRRALKAGEQI
jgi:hypothetical protein